MKAKKLEDKIKVIHMVKKGKSVTEVAKIMNITKVTVYNWLKGSSKLKDDKKMKVDTEEIKTNVKDSHTTHNNVDKNTFIAPSTSMKENIKINNNNVINIINTMNSEYINNHIENTKKDSRILHNNIDTNKNSFIVPSVPMKIYTRGADGNTSFKINNQNTIKIINTNIDKYSIINNKETNKDSQIPSNNINTNTNYFIAPSIPIKTCLKDDVKNIPFKINNLDSIKIINTKYNNNDKCVTNKRRENEILKEQIGKYKTDSLNKYRLEIADIRTKEVINCSECLVQDKMEIEYFDEPLRSDEDYFKELLGAEYRPMTTFTDFLIVEKCHKEFYIEEYKVLTGIYSRYTNNMRELIDARDIILKEQDSPEAQECVRQMTLLKTLFSSEYFSNLKSRIIKLREILFID